MALHVNDAEVTDLMNLYVSLTGMSKTEALRRLLREAVNQQERAKKKENFASVAREIIDNARKRNHPPVTKEEMDGIYE